MEQVMEKVKNTKILGMVGIVAILLGTFLPYFKVDLGWLGSGSGSLFKGDGIRWEGILILLVTIAGAVLIFKEYLKKYVPQFFNSPFGKQVDSLNEKMVAIPGVAAAVFAIIYSSNIDFSANYVKFGIGFWIFWLGVVALIAYAFLYKGNTVAQPIAGVVNPATPVSPVAPTETPVQTTVTQPVTPPAVPVTPTTTETPTVETAQPAAPVVKFCQTCGSPVDETTRKCTSCGQQY